MASELQNTLSSRRSTLEKSAETWESAPTVSSADASHFEGVEFGSAPCADDWLKSKVSQTKLEDDITEALDQVLLSRRAFPPSHMPGINAFEHEKRLTILEASLQKMHEALQKDKSNMLEKNEELSKREADVAATEQQILLEKEQQQQRKEEMQNYPQPPWLEKCDCTFNVAVTGNSGVGKSLLINKLRRVAPSDQSLSAPVGVIETTLKPTMYIFPGKNDLRLWDLPGAGTENFPRESYIREMGLRYFDCVIILTAERFSSMERKLMDELETHRVPYYMVRTKVDIDVRNNEQDNKMSEDDTLRQIRDDLEANCHGATKVYLVSSRDPKKGYDMPELLRDVFGLKHVLDASAPIFEPGEAGGWGDSWALPEELSQLFSGIQGRWQDRTDGCVYIVDGSEAHVTLPDGQATVVTLTEDTRGVWWSSHWYIDQSAVVKAREAGELRWSPTDLKLKPLVWRWCG